VGRGGGAVTPGVTKAAAWAGVSITLDPKVLEEAREVSPLRTRRSMTVPMTTGIYMGGGQYPLRCAFSDAEYIAWWNSIFHPDGAPPTNNDARGSIPPPENAWHGHQGADLHPTMNLPVSQ
jgi:hypothetical protein